MAEAGCCFEHAFERACIDICTGIHLLRGDG